MCRVHGSWVMGHGRDWVMGDGCDVGWMMI